MVLDTAGCYRVNSERGNLWLVLKERVVDTALFGSKRRTIVFSHVVEHVDALLRSIVGLLQEQPNWRLGNDTEVQRHRDEVDYHVSDEDSVDIIRQVDEAEARYRQRRAVEHIDDGGS